MHLHRIGDRRILRLIRKWLHAGVIEDGVWSVTEEGSPQGSVISPLLANVFLHYVFDLWIHWWRQQQARGEVVVVRYADDIRLDERSRRPRQHGSSETVRRRTQQALASAASPSQPT